MLKHIYTYKSTPTPLYKILSVGTLIRKLPSSHYILNTWTKPTQWFSSVFSLDRTWGRSLRWQELGFRRERKLVPQEVGYKAEVTPGVLSYARML